jgi:hypothetical protein
MNMKGILFLILGAILFMGCVNVPETPYTYDDSDEYYDDYNYEDEYTYEDEINEENEYEEEVDEYDYGMKEIIVPEGGMVYCVFDLPDGKMEYYFAENEAVLKQTNQIGDWTKTFVNQEEMCIEQYWYDDYYESGGMSEINCVPHSSENQYVEEIEKLKSSASIVATCSEISYDSKHFEFTE